MLMWTNDFQFQPEDWDDEEDGEWTAPTIPNPEYKGPWEPKVCRVCFNLYHSCFLFNCCSDKQPFGEQHLLSNLSTLNAEN